MIKILVLILFFLQIPFPVWAVTTNLADCEYATVSAAVSAASAGDVITCPTSATWSSHLQIIKGITLQGIGKPTITSNYDATDPGTTATPTNFLIDYSPDATERAADNLFRVSGFIFDYDNKCGGIGIFNTTATPTTKVRIDNNTIKNALLTEGGSLRAIMAQGNIYGVIDTNIFEGNLKCIDSYANEGNTWNNFSYSFGSANNLFYENNTFYITTTPHSGGDGGRYVARYNTYIYAGSDALSPWFDAHGNQLSGVYGTMATEVYNNQVTVTNTANGVLIHDGRGGKHRVYNNNVIVASGPVTLRVREEYSDDCSYTENAQPQHISESYYWNNTQNGSTLISCTKGTNCATTACNSGTYSGQTRDCYQLAENVDFFNAQASYVPYQCPHPLTGRTGTCISSRAGKGGYNITKWAPFYK